MTTQTQMTDAKSTTDRIEKHLVLRAPRARVWRALSDAREFAAWFGARLDGAFVEGATINARIVISGEEHAFTMTVESVEPERYFSYRWHPYAIDKKVDYAAEPMTLVEFILADTDGGTALTIVESGFDGIPLERRALAFRMNDNGWTSQMKKLANYVA